MFARRLRIVLLLAASAALVVAVSPALSTQRFVPAADDFSQPVPPVQRVAERSPRLARVAERQNGYGAEGRVLYRSAPVRAPHRFDLVGVAGETHALEFRAREEGEAWSDWVETDNGDPVYTGGATDVQVRSRGVPIEGRLHYVNVSGDETTASGLLTRLRSGVNSAVVSLFGAPEASAASPRPAFISRKEWGANRSKGGCQPRQKPDLGKIKAGVIHHTVSTNSYSEAEAPGVVLGICRYHRNGNGWDDIGYNALVDRFGNLYVGRAGGISKPLVGAHTEGHNSQTTGVATIGDHSSLKANSGTRRSLIRYLAWKLDLAGVDATGHTRLLSAGGSTNRTPEGKRIRVKPVLSHSDTNYTECAGAALRKQIGSIRRSVQRRIDRFAGGDGRDSGEGSAGGSGGATPGA